MLFLLDTDIASHVLYENEPVLRRMAAVSPDDIALSLVTRIEMLRGRIDAVLKAATAAELVRATHGLARTELFLDQFRIVPVDENAAATFERLSAVKKLNKMDRGDKLQPAVALANAATLVTRNTKDYANVPGLKVENWTA